MKPIYEPRGAAKEYGDLAIKGFIWCRGCDFSSDLFYSEKQAAEKWNRRPPERKC